MEILAIYIIPYFSDGKYPNFITGPIGKSFTFNKCPSVGQTLADSDAKGRPVIFRVEDVMMYTNGGYAILLRSKNDWLTSRAGIEFLFDNGWNFIQEGMPKSVVTKESKCLHCGGEIDNLGMNGYCHGCLTWVSELGKDRELLYRKKCIVKGCKNFSDQGGFVGDLCTPCHRTLTSDIDLKTNSQLARNLKDEFLRSLDLFSKTL